MRCSVVSWPMVFVLLSSVFAGVSGCRHSAKTTDLPYQQDAAMVTVSVMPLIPFAEVASELSPKIGLTFEQALKEAVQTSTSSKTLLRDMFTAALYAGITDGKSGVPDIEGKAAIPDVGDSGTMPDAGAASGVPAIIKYSSAVALYQEVKLLENYVKHALKQEGYSAYVLRVPITVFPTRRNLSLDVYTTLSFFVNRSGEIQLKVPTVELKSVLSNEEPNGGRIVLPKVVPLMVTEHLEAEQYDSQKQKLREYGMSLLLMFENLGIGGGVKNVREEFAHIVGSDYNTLMSLGRLSDNTIVARLGATRNPTVTDGGYEMLPRTHTASFLLLVHDDDICDSTRIDMFAKTDLHRTKDGMILSSMNTIQLLRGIKPLLRKYYRDAEESPAIPDRFLFTKQAPIENLVNAVVSNDDKAFRHQFENLLKPNEVGDKQESFKDYFEGTNRGDGLFKEQDFGLLWQEALGMVSVLKTNKVTFKLPASKKFEMPDPENNHAILRVGPKHFSAKLFGCKYLKGNDLTVTARLGGKRGKILLGAEKVTILGDGTGLAATFLSPKALNEEEAVIKKSILNVTVNNGKTYEYEPAPIMPPEEKKKVEKALLSIPDQIALAEGGTVGQLPIAVSGLAKVKDTLVVRIVGGNDAELKSIQGIGTTLGKPDKNGWRTLAGDGLVLLPVSGLRNGQQIMLILGVKKSGKVISKSQFMCTAISS